MHRRQSMPSESLEAGINFFELSRLGKVHWSRGSVYNYRVSAHPPPPPPAVSSVRSGSDASAIGQGRSTRARRSVLVFNDQLTHDASRSTNR